MARIFGWVGMGLAGMMTRVSRCGSSTLTHSLRKAGTSLIYMWQKTEWRVLFEKP